MTSFPEPHFVETNGIRMAVHEQGSGPAVILLHGFPELAYSWRFQMDALAGAGFRAIAPDQRGYGRTDAPPEVSDYAIEHLVGDVQGLMDALGVERATFVGHDWGALVLWHMAQVAPERMERLVQLNIPLFPRAPADPIEIMRSRFGDDFYIVNFQDSDEADRKFTADPARLFDRIMRRRPVTREQFEQLPDEMKALSLLRVFARDEPGGEALLTDAERDVFVSAFAASGFTGPINWYRNWTHNWKSLDGVDQRISMPTLFIGAVDDVIIAPEHVEAMKPLVDDLEIHMIEHCGHWTQQERPDIVNRLMLDWLARRA